MKNSQIERWTLEVIERVEAHQPIEDSRVELKAKWPDDPAKAARRIAGHANAARGEHILWLIEVDENDGVVGADYQEMTEWFTSVSGQFDGLAPRCLDLNVPTKDGKTVVALFFETDRAPFVVKNPHYGRRKDDPISLEVPWREGTSIRTSKRSELLQILSPLQQFPLIEVLDGSISGYKADEPRRGFTWFLNISLYFILRDKDSVVIPFHKCSAILDIEEALASTEVQSLKIESFKQNPTNAAPASVHLIATESELILQGSGKVQFIAWRWQSEDVINSGELASAIIKISPAIIDKTISIECFFKKTKDFRFSFERAMVSS